MSLPAPDHDDVTNLTTLEVLVDTVTLVSKETCGRPAGWRREQVSLAFAKVGITCWTLLRTIPGSSYSAPVRGMTSWDLSAAATRCRSLIEAYQLSRHVRYPTHGIGSSV